VVSEKNKIVLYTAIIGKYDTLKIPAHAKALRNEVDFFCYTDDEKLTSDFYTIRYIKRKFTDPTREARYIKINCHLLFPEYKYIIWMDANMHIITKSFLPYITTYLNRVNLALFKHPTRSCIYDEAMAIVHLDLDNNQLVTKQIAQYKEYEFPINFGLAATGIILRKNTLDVERFNSLWWEELNNGSRRDQLSFDYVRWKTGQKVSYLSGGSVFKNPIAVTTPHLRKNESLSLNRIKNTLKNGIKTFMRHI
jgi:hypothetical protein